MKLDWKLLLVLVMSLGLMIGCEDTDDPEETPAFEVLTDYMVEMGLDADVVVAGWTIAAADVNTAPENYFIVDLRTGDTKPANGTTDFTDGHIPGAVMSSLTEVVNTVDAQNTGDLPVVVVCYTGQTAGHAVVALRLSGYSDAKVMLFGMSAWNAAFDSWTGNIGSSAVGHANWSTAAAPTPGSYDYPEISTEETEGAAILAERIELILSGFNGVNGTDVLAAPGNYQIVNFWYTTDDAIGGENPYLYYGHLDGAYQIVPGTLTIANDGLMVLDPEAINVIYCWTGQTSSMMTAWLKALGYDVKSLKFGANGMIYTALEGHKWVASGDFAYE
jgi:rhodanese-related sulfurtransferase